MQKIIDWLNSQNEIERKSYLDSTAKIVESFILATSVVIIFLATKPIIKSDLAFEISLSSFSIVLLLSLLVLFQIKELHYSQRNSNTMASLELQIAESKKSETIKIDDIFKGFINRANKEIVPKEKSIKFIIPMIFIAFIVGIFSLVLGLIIN
jgi:hypothetical protein